MDLKHLAASSAFHKTIIGVGISLAALIIFQAGVFVGYHKAAFSYRFGDNYYRAFGPEHGESGGPMGIPRDELSGAYGAAGTIIKTSLPTIVIEAPDKTEKIILITPDTIIRHFRETASTSALTEHQFITVIGSPNDKGQIEAKLIRLLAPSGTAVPGNASTTPLSL